MVHREGALNWEKLLNVARSGKYVQAANELIIYNIPDDNEVSEGHLVFQARADGVCKQLTLKAKHNTKSFISRQNKYLGSHILQRLWSSADGLVFTMYDVCTIGWSSLLKDH